MNSVAKRQSINDATAAGQLDPRAGPLTHINYIFHVLLPSMMSCFAINVLNTQIEVVRKLQQHKNFEESKNYEIPPDQNLLTNHTN